MKKQFNFIFLLFVATIVNAQTLPYKWYNQKGKEESFEKVIKSLADYDVVFVGELHNNSINHWIELKIAEKLYQIAKSKNQTVVLGAEMFERDNQDTLSLYINNKIDDKTFEKHVRLWNNYATDYKSLVEFAKKNQLPFIATNVPRRYASIVAKKGIDSLNYVSEKEKNWMAKLPIVVDMTTPGYEEMKAMMGDHAGPNTQNFINAQAIKDATMAESIYKSIVSNGLFIHFNGHFHSKMHGGTAWYLNKLNPKLKIAVISVVESEDEKLPLPENTLEFAPTEFNLVIPSDMTKTY